MMCLAGLNPPAQLIWNYVYGIFRISVIRVATMRLCMCVHVRGCVINADRYTLFHTAKRVRCTAAVANSRARTDYFTIVNDTPTDDGVTLKCTRSRVSGLQRARAAAPRLYLIGAYHCVIAA